MTLRRAVLENQAPQAWVGTATQSLRWLRAGYVPVSCRLRDDLDWMAANGDPANIASMYSPSPIPKGVGLG